MIAGWGFREMAQSLRELAVHAEDPGSVPWTHVVGRSQLNSSSTGSNPLFRPPQALQQVTHRHTNRQKIHIHKTKIFKSLN